MRFLIVLNLILATVVGAEIYLSTGASVPLDDVPTQEATLEEMTGGANDESIQFADLADLSSIQDTPVFFASRRAPLPNAQVEQVQASPIPEGTPLADVPELQLTLLGTMIEGEHYLALVANKAGPAERLYPGDVVDGWQVVTIGANYLEMMNGERSSEFRLERAASAMDKKPVSRPNAATKSKPSKNNQRRVPQANQNNKRESRGR